MLKLIYSVLCQTEAIPVVPMPDVAKSGESAWGSLKGLTFDDAVSKVANSVVEFAFKLVIAIAVFYLGKFIIKRLYALVHGILLRRSIDPSVSTFVLSLVRMVLYFIVIVTVIGILGIETSSFLALFASAGVAIGMALSGTLQNFAGGVLILLLKPYKVGDFIEAQGYSGTVKAIQIFHTVINTPDNKAIVIPNGGLSTGSVNNYSLEPLRRVDWSIGLSYGDDFERASEVIKEMLLEDSRVLTTHPQDAPSPISQIQDEDCDSRINPDCKKNQSWISRLLKRKRKGADFSPGIAIDPTNGLPATVVTPPFVGLSELADSSINLTVRAWTRVSDYWALYFEMNRRFYKELPEKGFNFPFPQMDVHFDAGFGVTQGGVQK